MKPRCQICDGEGHVAKSCSDRYTLDSAHLASRDESDWYFDSGATAHVTRSPTTLDTCAPYSGKARPMVGNGNSLNISHTGSCELNSSLRLLNVLVAPEIKINLVSVSKLTRDFPVNVVFTDQTFSVQTREKGEILATGRFERGLYKLDKDPRLGKSKIRLIEKSLSLGEEILEEILPWLPVKSLLRFRCVSKSWLSLIDSKDFIETHKNTSSAHHRVIFQCGGDGLQQCSLHALLNETSTGLSSPTGDPWINEGYVVGCCNGLVCIRNQTKGRFLFWNPATRVSFKLPLMEGSIQSCGFGYDAASCAYKVFVVVTEHNRKHIGKVYSSKRNSWRTRVGSLQGRLPGYYGIGKFVCGKIHWLSPQSIYSFNLKSEVLGVIEHPCDLELGHQQQWLGEIKGCLSLVCDNNNTRELGVWIMKESWLKVLNVPFDFPYGYRTFTALIEIVSEGVVLLIYGSAFLALSRDDTHLLSAPKEFTGCFAVCQDMLRSRYDTTHFYVESLVSPVPYMNLSKV